jgi:hypothetical protein
MDNRNEQKCQHSVNASLCPTCCQEQHDAWEADQLARLRAINADLLAACKALQDAVASAGLEWETGEITVAMEGCEAAVVKAEGPS